MRKEHQLLPVDKVVVNGITCEDAQKEQVDSIGQKDLLDDLRLIDLPQKLNYDLYLLFDQDVWVSVIVNKQFNQPFGVIVGEEPIDVQRFNLNSLWRFLSFTWLTSTCILVVILFTIT
jgi:hypothetical protein